MIYYLYGAVQLIKPLAELFALIYSEKMIPDQWRVLKIILVHKKGNKQMNLSLTPWSGLPSITIKYWLQDKISSKPTQQILKEWA